MHGPQSYRNHMANDSLIQWKHKSNTGWFRALGSSGFLCVSIIFDSPRDHTTLWFPIFLTIPSHRHLRKYSSGFVDFSDWLANTMPMMRTASYELLSSLQHISSTNIYGWNNKVLYDTQFAFLTEEKFVPERVVSFRIICLMRVHLLRKEIMSKEVSSIHLFELNMPQLNFNSPSLYQTKRQMTPL